MTKTECGLDLNPNEKCGGCREVDKSLCLKCGAYDSSLADQSTKG